MSRIVLVLFMIMIAMISTIMMMLITMMIIVKIMTMLINKTHYETNKLRIILDKEDVLFLHIQ